MRSLLCAALLTQTVAALAAPEEAAHAYLESLRPSPGLQQLLDETLADLAAADPALGKVRVRVALIDMRDADHPTFAEHDGTRPVYPASVVKLVYLMAAYRWQELDRLTIDADLRVDLWEMIHPSSNLATQRVVTRLTGFGPGPALPPADYVRFRDARLSMKRWLEQMGISDLHCVHPTFNGNDDISERDRQLLRDASVAGGLPSVDGEFKNRQAMTALGTARLLALLATDRALAAEDARTVRELMRRDPDEQPYQRLRIAGGALRVPGVEVFSKSGTWGPIFADAGIVRHASGKQLVLVVFLEGTPPYRGPFIAELAERCAERLLCPSDPPDGPVD